MSNTRPRALIALTGLEIIIGLMGVGSSIPLLMDPSGASMGLEHVLPLLPIPDFTLLGLWFLLGYGAFPFYIAYNIWKGKPLGWKLAQGLAIFEILWIVAQPIFLSEMGFFIMQPIILGQALITLYLLDRKSVREYLGVQA